MPKVNIAEAARRAGIARSTLYEKYINPGKISVETEKRNGKECRVIDLAELHRVFGDERAVSVADSAETVRGVRPQTPENSPKNDTLQSELEALHQRLAAVERDKEWFRHHCDELTGQLRDVQRLLEHRPAVEPVTVEPTAAVAPAEPPALEDDAAVILEAERARVAELEAALAAERSKGFFARLFGR